MSETLDDLKTKYGNDLLFVGRRGSHSLGLQTDQSDEDLLVVVKNTTANQLQHDHIVMGLDTFDKQLKLVRLEIIEGLSTPVYWSNEFNYYGIIEQIIRRYDLFSAGLKSEMFKLLKNQIKQYDKAMDATVKAKFASKTYLYYHLLRRSKCLLWYFDSWVDDDLKKRYFKIKSGQKDAFHAIEKIRTYRLNNNRRQRYKDKINYVHNELAKLNLNYMR